MELDPETLSARDRYALLISGILPRPIAWVSTVSPEGVPNLAPFSFFTGVSGAPMSVVFAPVNDRHGRKKDTLLNVEATRQFVVNAVPAALAERMNETSANFPYGVSEFKEAGVEAAPSVKVRPPRVKESPISLECELLQVVTVSEGPLGGNLVLGRVVWYRADDKVWNGGRPRHQDLDLIGRMEGAWYARTRDAFELARPEAP